MFSCTGPPGDFRADFDRSLVAARAVQGNHRELRSPFCFGSILIINFSPFAFDLVFLVGEIELRIESVFARISIEVSLPRVQFKETIASSGLSAIVVLSINFGPLDLDRSLVAAGAVQGVHRELRSPHVDCQTIASSGLQKLIVIMTLWFWQSNFGDVVAARVVQENHRELRSPWHYGFYDRVGRNTVNDRGPVNVTGNGLISCCRR